MSRQYDNLNQYFCPSGTSGGIARPMCLRSKNLPPGFAGPASAYLECYDAETGATSAPLVWNPVYNRGSQPPAQAPAVRCSDSGCTSGGGGSCCPNTCGWVWVLVAIMIGLIVLILAVMATQRSPASCNAAKQKKRLCADVLGGFGRTGNIGNGCNVPIKRAQACGAC